jgi:hypothetical protein
VNDLDLNALAREVGEVVGHTYRMDAAGLTPNTRLGCLRSCIACMAESKTREVLARAVAAETKERAEAAEAQLAEAAILCADCRARIGRCFRLLYQHNPAAVVLL